jgi:CII-binding regulator of phage lambda lysogenization HflD
MSKIRVVKDNVLLSIDEEELTQYEARGYSRLGATKKVAPKDLEKELKKIKEINKELTTKITQVEEEKSEQAKVNEELTAKIAELEKKVK